MNANVKEPVGSALVVSIPEASALAVFTETDGIEPFLAIVRQHIDAFVGDVTTAKGRKEIASMAYRVAQSKTALEEAGKKVAAEAKEIPRKIDAARKHMKDTLDAWRDEVRAPLDAWEAAEKARVDRHVVRIEELNRCARISPDWSLSELRALLVECEAVAVSPESCDEFMEEYQRAKNAASKALRDAIEKRAVYEAEQAELAGLRALKAKRDAKDKAEAEEREQAERVRLAAEQAVQREREAAEARADAERRATQEAADRREREAREAVAQAEAAAQAERDASERREREHAEALAAAEARAKDAAADAQRAIERENAEHAAALKAREADTKHKASVNRAAMAAFIIGGLTDEQAMWAVTLIAQKKIPAVTIAY